MERFHIECIGLTPESVSGAKDKWLCPWCVVKNIAKPRKPKKQSAPKKLAPDRAKLSPKMEHQEDIDPSMLQFLNTNNRGQVAVNVSAATTLPRVREHQASIELEIAQVHL